MRIDIGNALAVEATPGVPEDALERIDERVETAHEDITRGMETEEYGYVALTLPDRTDPGDIREAVEPVGDPDAVLTVGIGGSALGAATVSTALGVSGHYVLDNVDPARTNDVLEDLPLSDTVVNVVSRSGTTPETLANFLVVREAMTDAGVDWTDRVVVTTGTDGPLRDVADRHDLPALDVPEGVPGRFSALSAVGLLPAELLGADVSAVLAGGRDGRAALAGSLFDCPAYAYGAVAHALEVRGATVNVMMPYAEALEPFAEWFAQLWAESLGKDGLGQTPIRALGVTDQHSQLQLYRAGRHDKLVTLVRARAGGDPGPGDDASGDDASGDDATGDDATGDDATADGGKPGHGTPEDRSIPDTDGADLSYLGGRTLGDLLEAEFQATEASLAASDQPNVRIEIDRLDARGVGELLYGMEAACILAGDLAGVSTFTQPAVEWGKRAARGLLGGGDFPDETAAVAEKTSKVIRSPE